MQQIDVWRRSGLGRFFLILLAAAAALWILFKPDGAVQNPRLFAEQVLNGLQLGLMYALIALGYTMVYGIVRLINFAHGDVFMVGAFVSYYAISRMHLNQLPIPGLPPEVGMIAGTVLIVVLAMVVCAGLATTIERVAYKPLRNAPRIAALITAIGVSFFLEYFAALPFVFTSNFIAYERPFPAVVLAEPFGLKITNVMVLTFVTALIFLGLLQWIVLSTKMGKAMRATAYDKPTARLMGINVDGVITFTFALGAALAGVGSVLYAIAYPQLLVFMGIMPGLKAFVAAVVGGIGSIPGAFIGSLIMGQAEMLSSGYISSPMRDAIAFGILILVLLVRPQGLFGEPEREKA